MRRVKKFAQKIPNVGYQDGGDDVARVRGRSVACSVAGTLLPRTFTGRRPYWPYNPVNHLTLQYTETTIAKLPQNRYARMQKERRTRMDVGTSSSRGPASDEMAQRMTISPVISLTSFCCCFYSSVLNLLFWKYKFWVGARLGGSCKYLV